MSRRFPKGSLAEWYRKAAQAYLRKLPPEHFMEAIPQGRPAQNHRGEPRPRPRSPAGHPVLQRTARSTALSPQENREAYAGDTATVASGAGQHGGGPRRANQGRGELRPGTATGEAVL